MQSLGVMPAYEFRRGFCTLVLFMFYLWFVVCIEAPVAVDTGETGAASKDLEH